MRTPRSTPSTRRRVHVLGLLWAACLAKIIYSRCSKLLGARALNIYLHALTVAIPPPRCGGTLARADLSKKALPAASHRSSARFTMDRDQRWPASNVHGLLARAAKHRFTQDAGAGPPPLTRGESDEFVQPTAIHRRQSAGPSTGRRCNRIREFPCRSRAQCGHSSLIPSRVSFRRARSTAFAT